MISALLLALALPASALSGPLHAVIHPDAKDWKPVSLQAGGNPSRAGTKATLRQYKVNGIYKGTPSLARASARLHKAGEDRWLVICVFPKALERRRLHFEVRFKIVEGFVEEARAAIISVVDRRPQAGADLDSFELRTHGVAFEEESPASGELLIAALDPRPSRSAVNSGMLKLAAFGDRAVSLADAAWSVKGLLPPN